MTIKEIARLAGVSVSTVSKVVNNKDDAINPQTRDRVLQIVKEYNYTPYGTIKSISAARTFLVGVLLRSVSSAGMMLAGILRAVQECSYSVLLFDSQEDIQLEAKHVSALCAHHVDSMIWEPVSTESLTLSSQFERQEIPVCLVNCRGNIPSLQIDYASMGYFLTQKLIGLRHTSIACLLQQDDVRSEQLLDGYRKCLYDYRVPFNERMIFFNSDEDYLQNMIHRNVSGVVCAYFDKAMALYRRLQRFRYRVPEDVSLVSLHAGYPGNELFPVSSLRIPYPEFGYHIGCHAVSLCEKTESEPFPGPFRLEWALTHEQSLTCPVSLHTKRFVVVGATNMDFMFRIPRMPAPGETMDILNATMTTGGKGANQAVGLARLGHEVSFICKIGNDADAAFISDTLEKEHVATAEILYDKNVPTGKAYIYIKDDGESTITALKGANSTFSPRDIEAREYLFSGADFCLITTDIPADTVVCAARTARRLGIRTVVNPASLFELPDGLLQNTDIFVPNRREAMLLCPSCDSIEQQAEFFRAHGAEIVIITLGHDGCYLQTNNITQYFPASDFTPRDTTGGGDAFVAALASYLSEGYPIESAVRIATYAAGFCISRQGVISILVDRATLEEYITKREPQLLQAEKS